MSLNSPPNISTNLLEKLNQDLQDYVGQLPPKPYQDGWSENNWEKEMEEHPAFMTKLDKESGDLPPLVEAFRQLKYDPEHNTPDELAAQYKNDGNENFRLKKYRWAVASYTEGLKQNCSNSELNAQLFTNRAAAHFHIGNFRSALRDASEARKVKPDHTKAHIRGAQCCWELHLYSQCIEWCQAGLQVDPDNQKLRVLMTEAEKAKKKSTCDEKKAAIREARLHHNDELIRRAIKDRKIRLRQDGNHVGSLEPIHPAAVGTKVHLDDNGSLVWPVLFLYPEHAESDFIQQFHEDSRFVDHLEVMFGSSDNQPPWDKDRKYIPIAIQIYFEDSSTSVLVPVKSTETLRSILSHERFCVTGGTPTFYLTAKNSTFDYSFRQKHGLS